MSLEPRSRQHSNLAVKESPQYGKSTKVEVLPSIDKEGVEKYLTYEELAKKLTPYLSKTSITIEVSQEDETNGYITLPITAIESVEVFRNGAFLLPTLYTINNPTPGSILMYDLKEGENLTILYI